MTSLWKQDGKRGLSLIVSLVVSLFYVEVVSASGFGDVSVKKQNCLSGIKSLPEYVNLPKLNEAQLGKWKDKNSDGITPRHDLKFVSKDDVLRHIKITYYFDIQTRLGFIEVRGGISDKSDWYGDFYLGDEIMGCLNVIKDSEK